MTYDEIYRTYHEPIRRFTARMCGSDEADDITQEVFIRVLNSMDNFRGDSSVKTWVYRIASNLSVDRMRSASFKAKKKVTVLADEIIETSAYADLWSRRKDDNPERTIIKAEMIDCVAEYVNAMNENFKTVIILSEFDTMSDGEIASVLGISINNVKIRLVRARNRLKKILAENCSITFDENNDICCEQKQIDQ